MVVDPTHENWPFAVADDAMLVQHQGPINQVCPHELGLHWAASDSVWPRYLIISHAVGLVSPDQTRRLILSQHVSQAKDC
jgi:hypothetical protein